MKQEYFTYETDEWVEDQIDHIVDRSQIEHYVIALKQYEDKRKALFIALTYPENERGDENMKT